MRRVGDSKLDTPRPHPWVPVETGMTVVVQRSPFAGMTMGDRLNCYILVLHDHVVNGGTPK